VNLEMPALETWLLLQQAMEAAYLWKDADFLAGSLKTVLSFF